MIVKNAQAGFTLTEFLVILAIVMLLLLFLARQLQESYIPRAQDAQRKSDLQKIKIAFEDYYNDNGCYPSPEKLQNCYSDELSPYLQKIPCDPATKQPYYYQPNPDNACSGYRLLAELQYTADPDVLPLTCDAPYNYGVSVGEPLAPVGCLASPSVRPSAPPASVPSPSVSPSTTPDPIYDGHWACDHNGVCNYYDDPPSSNCVRSYPTYPQCVNGCPSHPELYCLQ